MTTLLYYTRLAGKSCRIHGQDTGSFFQSWQWRLDPYLIPEPEDVSLTIEMTPGRAVEPVGEMLRDEISGFFRRQVFRARDSGTLWQLLRGSGGVYLQYHVSPDWKRITLLEDSTQTAGQMAFEYLGQMMPHVLLNHEILTFHGVLLEHAGRGIVLAAPSGTGKTTHARLWRDCKDALILNGDRAACRRVDGVWTGFGLPWSGTSGEQINRSVPLTALVLLERGERNEVSRLAGMEAFGTMWPHTLYPGWDGMLTGTALELVDDCLSRVPVLRLRCRPDSESVAVLGRALEEL